MDGIEQYYPTRWPIELFKSINYFEEFPQNILLVSGAKKERKALESLIGKYGKNKDFKEIKLGDFSRTSNNCLRHLDMRPMLLYSQEWKAWKK